jgi:hypothetical protein
MRFSSAADNGASADWEVCFGPDSAPVNGGKVVDGGGESDYATALERAVDQRRLGPCGEHRVGGAKPGTAQPLYENPRGVTGRILDRTIAEHRRKTSAREGGTDDTPLEDPTSDVGTESSKGGEIRTSERFENCFDAIAALTRVSPRTSPTASALRRSSALLTGSVAPMPGVRQRRLSV